MKIGKYEISTIETGYVSLDGGAMFGVVPKTLWSKTNPADDLNRIILAMRLLVIKGNDRLIIVDDGAGKKMSEKLSTIYNLDYTKFDLHAGLIKESITPESVTDVLLTHLHFDHCGGTTYYNEKGELRLTFPNAVHHIQKDHWNWGLRPSERDGASFMRENFLPIQEFGKLNLIDGPGELYPGIELMVLNGHTKAMQTPKISDGRSTLFYCADLFPTSAHIPLPYIMGYDIQPMNTLTEKKAVLPRAMEEEWLLVFEHDPYHLCGKVQLSDKGYAFGETIETL